MKEPMYGVRQEKNTNYYSNIKNNNFTVRYSGNISELINATDHQTIK